MVYRACKNNTPVLIQRHFGVSRAIAFGGREVLLPWGQRSRGGKMNILNKKNRFYALKKSLHYWTNYKEIK